VPAALASRHEGGKFSVVVFRELCPNVPVGAVVVATGDISLMLVGGLFGMRGPMNSIAPECARDMNMPWSTGLVHRFGDDRGSLGLVRARGGGGTAAVRIETWNLQNLFGPGTPSGPGSEAAYAYDRPDTGDGQGLWNLAARIPAGHAPRRTINYVMDRSARPAGQAVVCARALWNEQTVRKMNRWNSAVAAEASTTVKNSVIAALLAGDRAATIALGGEQWVLRGCTIGVEGVTSRLRSRPGGGGAAAG
jgi:hypothetical protein